MEGHLGTRPQARERERYWDLEIQAERARCQEAGCTEEGETRMPAGQGEGTCCQAEGNRSQGCREAEAHPGRTLPAPTEEGQDLGREHPQGTEG